jgi:hypothetical protein
MTTDPKPKQKRKSVPRPYAALNKKPLPPEFSSETIRVTALKATVARFKRLKAQERGTFLERAFACEDAGNLPPLKPETMPEIKPKKPKK